MKTPLYILLLEDSKFDTELIAVELGKLDRPFRLETIQSEAELRRALDLQPPDIILSDHGLPSFDGFMALGIVRHKRPTLPFIFLSGSNDQQMVADMHDRGATDYVFKNDLADLCPAILRALTKQPKASVPEPTSSPKGHLLFCPKCGQARDENGKMVEMGKYLSSFPEVTIRSQSCVACSGQALG